MKNLSYLLALHSVDGLGPVRLSKILEYFGDPKIVWEAPLKEVKSVGIPENVLQNLKQKRISLDPEKYHETIQKSGISILTIFDGNYPETFKRNL
jgi:DNA processing protein